MKRRDLLKAAATGMAAAPLALSSTTANAGDKVRLRMQTLYGTETDDLYKAFADDVKTVSNKTVRIQRFRGSELVPNDQMLDAVSKGTLDMCQGYAVTGRVSWTSLRSNLVFQVRGLATMKLCTCTRTRV